MSNIWPSDWTSPWRPFIWSLVLSLGLGLDPCTTVACTGPTPCCILNGAASRHVLLAALRASPRHLGPMSLHQTSPAPLIWMSLTPLTYATGQNVRLVSCYAIDGFIRSSDTHLNRVDVLPLAVSNISLLKKYLPPWICIPNIVPTGVSASALIDSPLFSENLRDELGKGEKGKSQIYPCFLMQTF